MTPDEYGAPFQVGAAKMSLVEPFMRYFAEEEKPLKGVKGEHGIRCLLMKSGATLTAVFNTDMMTKGFPRKFALAAQEALCREAGDAGFQLQSLFFATHNHTNPSIPRPIRQARKRHWLYQEMLRAMVALLRAALDNMRPAVLRIGQGEVSSISGNSDQLNGDYDPAMHVLRFDGEEGNLIAALVNFACHPTIGYGWCSEALQYLSGDFPSAMEAFVQRNYGDVPVLFLNGACGDIQPAVRRVDPKRAPPEVYETMVAQLRWTEIERVGRVLGSEVCKALAELEAASEELERRCDRWGYAGLCSHSPGRRIAAPQIMVAHCPVALPWRMAPDPDVCAKHVAYLSQQAAELERTLPLPERLNQKRNPQLLRAESEEDPLFQRMSLYARLTRWKKDLQLARAGSASFAPINTSLSVLAFDRDAAAICFSLEMHHETAVKIRAKSPFPLTLMFGYFVSKHDVQGYLTTDAKLALGGYHTGNFDSEAERTLIDAAVSLLHQVRGSLQ